MIEVMSHVTKATNCAQGVKYHVWLWS